MTYHIIIDTNVIIAALRSKRGASNLLLRLLGTKDWQAHLSIPLVLEYEEICLRLLAELGISLVQLNDFFRLPLYRLQSPQDFLFMATLSERCG